MQLVRFPAWVYLAVGVALAIAGVVVGRVALVIAGLVVVVVGILRAVLSPS
jgi:uncharacterized membrane protein